jgi:small subunit ribosomal protein S17
MKDQKSFKKKLDGIVTSDKCDKTITVSVINKFKHPKYSKFVYKTKKYYAHDRNNEAKEGDKVTIIASRPYSKTKKWELISINK